MLANPQLQVHREETGLEGEGKAEEELCSGVTQAGLLRAKATFLTRVLTATASDHLSTPVSLWSTGRKATCGPSR